MKKILALFVFFYATQKVNAQQFLPNTCDSSYMDKETYQKCLEDTFYTPMINLIVDHYSFVKTAILPKYRDTRKKIVIPESIQLRIRELRQIYDSSFKKKLWEIGGDVNRNMKYVSPKSNIVTLLSLEHFRIYPDIYAILLNELHLLLNPRSSKEEVDQIAEKIEFLYASLPVALKNELEQIIIAMQKDKFPYENKVGWRGTFQGDISDEDRMKYRVIDFLIWDE